MKKLLLTLGSAAAVAAPLTTVVACGDESSVLITTVSGNKLSIIGFRSPKVDLNDEDEYKDYVKFMEEIGTVIKELDEDEKSEITQVALDGHVYELQGDDTYKEYVIDTTINLTTDLPMSVTDLADAISQTPGKDGLSSEAGVFGALISIAQTK